MLHFPGFADAKVELAGGTKLQYRRGPPYFLMIGQLPCRNVVRATAVNSFF